MYSVLDYFEAIHPLSAPLRQALNAAFVLRNVSRREVLLCEGETCRNLYFVEKGLLRGYYFKHGREISCWFGQDNELCTSAESFTEQTSGREIIQAIVDTRLRYISHDMLQGIYKEFPAFNIHMRLLAEQNHIFSEEKLAALRLQRANERYEWLMRRFPELFLYVPAKLLASYIGMTEVTLSIKRGDNIP